MIGGPVARHTITIVRAPLVDDGRGNLAFNWVGATETASPGWAIDTDGVGDDQQNREGARVTYTLRGPYDADVLSTDRVRLFDGLLRIDGGVLRQPGATPTTAHTIIRVTAWEG